MNGQPAHLQHEVEIVLESLASRLNRIQSGLRPRVQFTILQRMMKILLLT